MNVCILIELKQVLQRRRYDVLVLHFAGIDWVFDKNKGNL